MRLAVVALSMAAAATAATSYAPLMEDNTAILDVAGRSDVNPNGWADSYSVGNACYCKTNFDHAIDVIAVSTPLGNMTVKQACTLLGPGPGWEGRPRYNDIQCGNGPPNQAGDETPCPGRVEYGKVGCKYIGPKWNFAGVGKAPTKTATKAPVAAPIATKVPVKPPTKSPVKPPTKAPFTGTVSIPVASPVSAPVSQYAPLLLDNTAILNVVGRKDVNPKGWADSYSVGNSCYCKTNFDHNIDVIVVSTPFGNMTVKQVCTLLGPGPGWDGRPRYNDIQCGNGPPNNAGDEDTCPGRVEYGKEGCKYIGPKWNFAGIKAPTKSPVRTPVAAPSAPAAPVTTGLFVQASNTSGSRFTITGTTKLNNAPNGTIPSGVVGYNANLFSSHRWSASNFSYSFSGFTPGSRHTMTLGFAETYQPNCAAGKRVFHIHVNGVLVISNFDTFAAGGCMAAYITTLTVAASSNGTIDVGLVKIQENPFVSLLHIVPK
jgi:Malectin domain